MKYDYERIALWGIVIILVVAVFFQQRRSGFAIQAGNETSSISMLDMMEYRTLPEIKRTMYKQMLASNAAALTQMTNGMQYRMRLDQILMTALNMSPTTPTPDIPPPGLIPPPSTGQIPPYLTTCTNAIVFDTCTSSPDCPANMSTRIIGNLKFCTCPATMPVLTPPMTAGGIPMCVASCPTTMTKRLTLTATGQQMCVSMCPPMPAPGITCV